MAMLYRKFNYTISHSRCSFFKSLERNIFLTIIVPLLLEIFRKLADREFGQKGSIF